MNDDVDFPRAVRRRQLWNLGRPLLVLVAPLLVRLANRDKRFVWTLEEVRGHARDWPPTGGDVEMANLFRFQAWFGASMVPLAVYIAASLLRPEVARKRASNSAVSLSCGSRTSGCATGS
ncbi:hypothetical protein [Micromonospora sp. NPDC005237]|uniref:hypothetical protein n=1 Tax=Micromonospora sp. NPDC005237 TaxID=3155113 RepID=UPI0033A5D049